MDLVLKFPFINGEVSFTDMDYMVGDKVEIRTESGCRFNPRLLSSPTTQEIPVSGGSLARSA